MSTSDTVIAIIDRKQKRIEDLEIENKALGNEIAGLRRHIFYQIGAMAMITVMWLVYVSVSHLDCEIKKPQLMRPGLNP